MVQAYSLPKCPHCGSLDIKPVGTKLFHCKDCGNDFPEAVVEEEPPAPKKGKEK